MSAPVNIYVFNNGGVPGFYQILALCECGDFIASHVCSDDDFIRVDMGFGTSTRMHDRYREHLVAHHTTLEWELHLVHPFKDERLAKAYAKHLEKRTL